MRPRYINIVLLDCDPDGIRVAQVSMSTIQAIAFCQLQMKQVWSILRRADKQRLIYPIALDAVQRLDALFDIERSISGKIPLERVAVRQELSAPRMITQLVS